VLLAVISALNALRSVAASSWNVVHADTTSTTNGDFQNPIAKPALFVAPAATDLPSLLLLCAELAGRHILHLRDGHAHRAADAANLLANAPPTTLAAAQVFLTDAKARWNAHLTQAGVHYATDTTDAIAVADATDLPTAIALANAYRVAFAAHIQNALYGASIQLIGP
jgi:hypothetical protein